MSIFDSMDSERVREAIEPHLTGIRDLLDRIDRITIPNRRVEFVKYVRGELRDLTAHYLERAQNAVRDHQRELARNVRAPAGVVRRTDGRVSGSLWNAILLIEDAPELMELALASLVTDATVERIRQSLQATYRVGFSALDVRGACREVAKRAAKQATDEDY